MARFLLWNVRKRPEVDALVRGLVRQYAVEVVLLVEYAFGQSVLPALLLSEGLTKASSGERFGVFARDGHHLRRLRHRVGRRAGLWRWTPPSGTDGLVAVVHAPARPHAGDGSRRIFFRRVAEAVRRAERAAGHRRSLVAGDFNANPFDPAVVAADGLHAVGVVASGWADGRRRVGAAGTHVDYFYNPMWAAYGKWDRPADAPGDPPAGAATYYRARDTAYELGWHMLDQVVVRPQEVERFPRNGLRIVTTAGTVPLLDGAGRPDMGTGSDHLPLMFDWHL